VPLPHAASTPDIRELNAAGRQRVPMAEGWPRSVKCGGVCSRISLTTAIRMPRSANANTQRVQVESNLLSQRRLKLTNWEHSSRALAQRAKRESDAGRASRRGEVRPGGLRHHSKSATSPDHVKLFCTMALAHDSYSRKPDLSIRSVERVGAIFEALGMEALNRDCLALAAPDFTRLRAYRPEARTSE
jgi:hypothetical protein